MASIVHSFDPPIIHGDLSPSNILVNDAGEACLCDFGLARIWEHVCNSCCTSTGGGQARFMAPELIGGAETRSFQTDIFSTGCIAYEVRDLTLRFA